VINFRGLLGDRSRYINLCNNIKERGGYTVDIPEVKVPNAEPKNAQFKVGINQDGQTQLTVGDGYITTLTMNDASVARLIKLLAVTIEPNYTVTVTENE
jgi:hypothetical protein